jgi:hypothetical protein
MVSRNCQYVVYFQGFLGPVTKDADLDISQENIDDLFINVEEIYEFNW